MAFDEGLAERLREQLSGRDDLIEKRMFGGLCFMLSGNMCCGIVGDLLMLRVGPEQYKALLDKPYAREMDFTGRALKGMLYIEPEGIAEDSDLKQWLGYAVRFAESLPPK